ncbi:mitochondrial-processing peptidase subunit beta-like [Schistocerca gregaria]|uniref:mitochondrial-processing peptidase subunit beta-like n=1 Tax=Schistocerca gregaria TaxID=7010 RepID=UPI00211DDB71|nr:mitochondrial-processing peptidase subunit beta-like [Schistocerca gregaria]
MSVRLFSGLGAAARRAPSRDRHWALRRRVSDASKATAVPPYLLNTAPLQLTTLPNGIRVATEETGSETVTVGVYIDAGSAYETEETNGAAHFLEHMAFKGTTNRTQEQIELEVENMGAQLNAYTSREHTVYVGRAFKSDMPKIVDILGDILQNSKLEPAHIERERSVILTEKEVVESNLEEVVFDYLHASAYQGTPLARTILGEEKNIRSLKREDLVNYIKTHYTGRRLVVAAVGSVNHDQLVDHVQKEFSQLPADSDFDFGPLADTEFTGSEIKVQDDTLHEVHAAVGFKSVSWSEPDYITFMLLQSMIGSWDRSMGGGNSLNSRLSEIVSDENLAHSYSTFNTCYNRTGLFGVYFVSDYNRVDEMCAEVMREFALARNVTPQELERAKNRVKSAYLMQLDGTSAVCEDIGRQLLTLGRRMSPIEVFLRIDKVTVEDIRRVAWDHFRDVDPVVSAIGPLKYFPDYNLWRTRTTEL